PGLAGLRRQLRLATLETLLTLERRCCFVQRAHHERPLVCALRRKHFARLGIDTVCERAHDCQCLCLFHFPFTSSLQLSLHRDERAATLRDDNYRRKIYSVSLSASARRMTTTRRRKARRRLA